MKSEEIKNIMIVYSDNDFIRVWDWIGKVLLETILCKNACFEKMLEDSETIEDFVFSLLPVAIEFAQYKVGRYEKEKFVRYRDLSKDEANRLTECFKNIKFVYNFDETHNDWISGGSETLIIDLENYNSYIQ